MGTFGAVFRVQRIGPGSRETLAMKVVRRATATASREVNTLLLLREHRHENVLELNEYFFASGENGHLLLCTLTPFYEGNLRTLLERWERDREEGRGGQSQLLEACRAGGVKQAIEGVPLAQARPALHANGPTCERAHTSMASRTHA